MKGKPTDQEMLKNDKDVWCIINQPALVSHINPQ